MIKKEEAIVGNRFICTILGANGIILEKTPTYITVENYRGPVYTSGLEACSECRIEVILKPIVTNLDSPRGRLDLISDSGEEMIIVPTLSIQDNSTFEEFIEQENYSKDTEIIHALDQAKDFLHQKLKYKGQQVQAKKDMAATYREAIKIVDEEINALITKIDSLKDQLKINKLK